MGFSLKKLVGGIGRIAVGAITGGPIGAIAAGVGVGRGLVGGGMPTLATTLQQRGLVNIGPPGQGQTGIININPGGGGMIPYAPQQGKKTGTQVMAPGAACPVMWDGRKYVRLHPNKSTYVTRGGGTSRWPVGLQLHPAGSECVKTRHLNPANGKAALHALRRLSAFHHMARRVERHLRSVAGRATRGGARSSHGKGCKCGCKG